MAFGNMLNNMFGNNSNNQEQQNQMIANGNWKFETYNELYCKCSGSGDFYCKKGAMVAYESDRNGGFHFEKALLGPNGGSIGKQIANNIARRVTGEYLQLTKVSGSGTIYLADLAQHITIIELEPTGPWNSILVESESIVMLHNVYYSVVPIGVGVISQKGMFTGKLTYAGPGACVGILTNGNPLLLQSSPTHPVVVDPDAVVIWTQMNNGPEVKFDVGWKNLLNQSSGESYSLQFNEDALILVQPYERNSGMALGDTNRPQMQQSPRIGSSGRSNNDLENIINQLI